MWKLEFAVAIAISFVMVHANHQFSQNFLVSNTLPDGEIEHRIFFNGITAKETTIGASFGLKFRQLAPDRHHLIQLIYAQDILKDCEVVHEASQVRNFLNTFNSDLSEITNNFTAISDSKLVSWMNFTKLQKECRKRHKELKQVANQAKFRVKRSVLIVPGTLWCGHSQSASNYSELGVMTQTDKCCRRHDHCTNGIPGFTIKFHYHNLSPFTLSHCNCDSRRRRDLSDLLRIPGTKWCGKGYSADKYTRLGAFSSTDKCCRRHDMGCPFWIGAFDTKYGLFNWRVNTIMHCSCDERFRACLKMVDSSDANLVGKLFFNVVQSKCFVLKPKKRCIRRSWWGKCDKYKYDKRAILRDNVPY